MISILLPSRGRLWSLERLVTSIFTVTADPDQVEVIVYDDNDPGDDSYAAFQHPRVKMLRTPERQVLSRYWDLACQQGSGPIYMLCNDDVVFQTPGWDFKVQEAFAASPDKILLVFGDDGDPNQAKHFGALPFIHENWVQAVGYFVPPYFSGDFVDTWLNDVAAAIGRKVKINILTEHMHPAFGKGEYDLTRAEKTVKHWKDDMPGLYASKADERLADAEKLRRVIEHSHSAPTVL